MTLILFYTSSIDPFSDSLSEESSVMARGKTAPISLSVSVYILDDQGDRLSSVLTKKHLRYVFRKVNQIWAQAAIKIKIGEIRRLSIESYYLQNVLIGRFEPFFNGLGRFFKLPAPSLLNAFYAKRIGRMNGLAFVQYRVFFVADYPTVRYERVTAHEIGHILGLSHAWRDRNRLMYSGTNGTKLTIDEISTARSVAHRLLKMDTEDGR